MVKIELREDKGQGIPAKTIRYMNASVTHNDGATFSVEYSVLRDRGWEEETDEYPVDSIWRVYTVADNGNTVDMYKP